MTVEEELDNDIVNFRQRKWQISKHEVKQKINCHMLPVSSWTAERETPELTSKFGAHQKKYSRIKKHQQYTASVSHSVKSFWCLDSYLIWEMWVLNSWIFYTFKWKLQFWGECSRFIKNPDLRPEHWCPFLLCAISRSLHTQTSMFLKSCRDFRNPQEVLNRLRDVDLMISEGLQGLLNAQGLLKSFFEVLMKVSEDLERA